jgi:predicted metal-binding membrane protein
METAPVAPSRQTKAVVWVALLVLASIAWTIVVIEAQDMGSLDQGMAEMAAEPMSLLFFLPLWVTMMAAMMFPAVAPVIVLFATLSHKRRATGQTAAPAWIFIAGYLAVWSMFGLVAYLLSLIVPAVGMAATGLRTDSALAAGIVLSFAGLYQLSPLKRICLHHCRSPLAALMDHWREGHGGALGMGARHGAYCLGCCWGLMLVLFAVGLMNVGWMLVLTAVIFAEKVLPYGETVNKLTAIVLVCFGLATLVASVIPIAAG